jgi:hypothetical protein
MVKSVNRLMSGTVQAAPSARRGADAFAAANELWPPPERRGPPPDVAELEAHGDPPLGEGRGVDLAAVAARARGGTLDPLERQARPPRRRRAGRG